MSLAVAILSCALAAGACHPSGAPGAYGAAVRVAGVPGTAVELRALDVPRGWIASFCTARVCTPRRAVVRLPPGAPLTIGVNYIPSDERPVPLREVHLLATAADARAGAREAVR